MGFLAETLPCRRGGSSPEAYTTTADLRPHFCVVTGTSLAKLAGGSIFMPPIYDTPIAVLPLLYAQAIYHFLHSQRRSLLLSLAIHFRERIQLTLFRKQTASHACLQPFDRANFGRE